MNIDTDISGHVGMVSVIANGEPRLPAGQIGNPTGEDAPNKKYYDPRVWLRAGRFNGNSPEQAFSDLNMIDVL